MADSLLATVTNNMSLDEPRVFTKTLVSTFDEATPRLPYLTFSLGPGRLSHLVIKIWSRDQGQLIPVYSI